MKNLFVTLFTLSFFYVSFCGTLNEITLQEKIEKLSYMREVILPKFVTEIRCKEENSCEQELKDMNEIECFRNCDCLRDEYCTKDFECNIIGNTNEEKIDEIENEKDLIISKKILLDSFMN